MPATPDLIAIASEIISKARDLITPILGAEKSSKLIELVFQLDGVHDIRELRPLLQAG